MTSNVIPLREGQPAPLFVLVDADELARLREVDALMAAPYREILGELTKLRDLREEFLAFAELVETRRKARWFNVPRKEYRRVCAAADFALEEEK